MMLGQAIDTGTRTASINTDAASVGVVAANAFAGFDHVAGRIFAAGTQKYLTAPGTPSTSTNDPVFITKGASRDQEFTGWLYLRGNVYLRYANGSAISFEVVPGSDEFTVSWRNNIALNTSSVYGTTIYAIQARRTLTGLIPGFSPNHDTDLWTFGCQGKDLYAKYNGTTFWTGELWQYVVPGKIMGQTGYSDNGFRDVVCSFLPQADALSDYSNKIIDPRDWGFKSLTTTGSMTGGSATLTVASNPGFAIGDKIIVEIGGEAGAGEIGTKGVGGTWPRYSYANEASLPDATTFRNTYGEDGVDAHVWLEDTGKVWINYLSGGVPTWGNWTDNAAAPANLNYYSKLVMPKALKATITNIVGTTFTLDTAATVSTTNANVYYDCGDAITNSLCVQDDSGLGNNRWIDNVTYRFPAGNYCLSDRFETKPATNWTFEGAGRSSTVLFSPKGARNFTITQDGRTPTFRDFKMTGWAGVKYWMSESDVIPPLTEPCLVLGLTTLYGNQYVNEGGLIERVDTENCWQGPKMAVRNEGLMRDCVGIMSNGNLQAYRTWYFQHSYCTDTWYEDITYIGDQVGNAFELFGAYGGGMRRINSTNGLFASNASGRNYSFDTVTINVDFNDNSPADWNIGNPAININLNIGDGTYVPDADLALGGTIVNPTITMIKRASDGYMPGAITINGQINCRVYGTHPAKPGVGVITMSNYAPGDVSNGAMGVVSDTAGTVVDGIRVIGTAANPNEFSNISLRRSDATVSNCVAEAISQYVSSTWLSRQGQNGNITNAQYEAL